MLEKVAIAIMKISDVVLLPFTLVAWTYFKMVRRHGINMFVNRMPLTKKLLLKIGVFPITDHYYDPYFDYDTVPNGARQLPWIDFNVSGQLELLDQFSYQEELENFDLHKSGELKFHYINGSFPPGDSEFLYSLIRNKKPGKIVEIGSGNSTLMAIEAISKNRDEDPSYSCEHICIEPYEAAWLEKTNVTVLREKVENVPASIFESLGKNDILFIDSSHVIKPGGDVLIEYLQILPGLKKGVLVHVHDIFTPYNYPRQWIWEGVSFWNEQYLLEAFVSNNDSFRIIGMLNYMNLNHHEALTQKFPILRKHPQSPGSFWLEKIA